MINLFNINNYKVDTSQFNNHLHGSIVQDFEKSFAKYVGAKYACSVSSATNAIFLVFEGTQEKVIIPSMLPPVVNNALLKAGCSIEYEDNVEWVGDSYKLHEFTNYKVIDSAQKVKKNQFKIELGKKNKISRLENVYEFISGFYSTSKFKKIRKQNVCVKCFKKKIQ